MGEKWISASSTVNAAAPTNRGRPQSDCLTQTAADERAERRRAEQHKAPGCGHSPQQPHGRYCLAQADLIDKIERAPQTVQRQRRAHGHDRIVELIRAREE